MPAPVAPPSRSRRLGPLRRARHRRPGLLPRRLVALALVSLVGAASAAPVGAAWTATGRGPGAARAAELPAGPRPGVVADGRAVTLSWARVDLGGEPAAGYLVERRDATTEAAVPESGGCAGVVAATTCRVDAVPAGRWTWSLRVAHRGWTGPAGAASDVVVLAEDAADVVPSSAEVGATVTLSGRGFSAGEQVEARIGDDRIGAAAAAPDGAVAVSGRVPIVAGGDVQAVLRGATSGLVLAGTLRVVPSASVTPASSRGGTSLSVVATGLPPSVAVTASYDGRDVATGSTGAAGRVVLSTTAPYAPAGARVVTVRWSSGSTSTEHVVVPGVTVSPSTARPGDRVAVSGDGFPAGGVEVLLDGAVVGSSSADAEGRVAPVTVDVPGNAAPGSHPVGIRAAGGEPSATGELVVTSGTVTTTLTRATPRTQMPLVLEGWPAGARADVRLGAASVCSVGIGVDGRGTASCAVPQVPRGLHALTAVVGGATATGPDVEVVPGTTPSSFSASPGARVTLSAAGFAAGAPLTTSFDGGPPVAAGTTTASGTHNVYVDVPSGAQPGEHVLRVSDGGAWADVPVTVLAPTITFTPTSGRARHDVFDATVAGFPPSVVVHVVIGGATACALTTDATGSRTGSCTVPDRPAGDHEVRAVSGSVTATAAERFTVLPHVAVGTPAVSPGRTASLTISGFPSGTTTIRIGGVLVSTYSHSSSVNRVVTVPDLPAGEHEVRVDGQGGVTASATIRVYRPVLTVPATSGPVGTSVPVSGTGWVAGDEVIVRIGTVVMCRAIASAAGDVDTTCAFPAMPGGTYSVGGSQHSDRVVGTAAQQVTVVPHVAVSPSSVAAGGTITVTLTGFGASTTVALALDDGTSLGSTGTAGNGSRFVSVTVPSGTAPGERRVVARDAGGREASAPLTVTAPAVTAQGEATSPAKAEVRRRGRRRTGS